jgi:2-methylisocitrate lyase-like PEP mutase family enzyme
MENPARLYDSALAVERIKAARAAIDQSGTDTILVARTEGLLHDKTALTPAIDRLVAFAAAGADCLFAPGVWGKSDIATMVRAVAPKPLNVLVRGPDLGLAELADLGVRRISIGGALARVAWKAVLETAQQIEAGDFRGLANGMAHGDLNNIFA